MSLGHSSQKLGLLGKEDSSQTISSWDPCLHVLGFSEDLSYKRCGMQGWLEKPQWSRADAIPAACHLFEDSSQISIFNVTLCPHPLMPVCISYSSLFTELNVLPCKPAVPPALSHFNTTRGIICTLFLPLSSLAFPII